MYLRKSRGEEDDLAKHESILEDICTKNNWRYVQYKEIGSSDSIELRPEMKKLLYDIEKETYDAVLVVDYDRLSRGDMGQQDKIKKIFRKANTLIITPNKIYDLNNEIDDTYTDFQGLIARREYKMITKRLRQGKKIGAKMGNWTNGSPPFGYSYERYKDKYNEKGLVVNDEEAEIYRYIIEKAVAGETANSIAWDLNKKGIRTRQYKLWSHVAIYRILQNETYLGKIITNKQKGDGHKIKKANAEEYKRLPKSEWVIVEDCHEALIVQGDFDKIQLMISSRCFVPAASRTNKGEFTGILKCGCCGHTMQVQKRNKDYQNIKGCSYKDEQGNKCKNRGGNIKVIREEIKKAILVYKEEIINKLDNSKNRNLEYISSQLKIKYNELKKYENALDKVQELYEIGEYRKEEFLKRKHKWEEKIDSVESEIKLLDKQLKSNQEVSDEQRLNIIEYFLENIDEIQDATDRNKLYKTILDSVVWKRIGKEEPILEINFL